MQAWCSALGKRCLHHRLLSSSNLWDDAVVVCHMDVAVEVCHGTKAFSDLLDTRHKRFQNAAVGLRFLHEL